MSSAKLGNFNQCVAKTTCMDHVLFWLVGNHTCNTRFTFIKKSFLALLSDLRAATWRCPKSCGYRQKIVVLNPWTCFFFSEVTLFNELRWPQSCPDVMNVDDHPLEGTGRSLQKPRPNIPHVVRFSRKFAITRIHHSQGRSIQVFCSFRLFTSVSRPWYFSKLSCFWFRMGYPNL